MARVGEFDDFYAASRYITLAATYAKCGDRQVARDATVDAYRLAWREWPKWREGDTARLARENAWQRTAVIRGTHPLRRRHEEDGDAELLEAMAHLDQDTRRLVSLMTVADLDLDEAALEIGLDDEEALEQASRGFARLEQDLGTDLDQVAQRLRSLSRVAESVTLPPAEELRRSAASGARRQTVLTVAIAVLVALVGGVLVSNGDATARQGALPDREQLGSETRDIVLDSHNLGTDDLLSVRQISALTPPATWKIEATDTDVNNTTPYATCPTTRFADDDPLKVFVRAYTNDGGGRATQSIEVSRSEEASKKAYERLVSFYAGCEHPRVRLIDSYVVERPFGDFQILRLQSYRSPARFISVGLAQSGTLTSTLVQETPGTERSDVQAFAAVLNQSVIQVCADSGGDCTRAFEVIPAPPPPAGQNGFLGVVDLPPVADIDEVWSASDPIAVTGANPASTWCNEAPFRGDQVVSAASRLFAIPEAVQLPEQFALTQTTGRFVSDKAAAGFVSAAAKRLTACTESKDVPATLDSRKKIAGTGFVGTSWRVGLEVKKGSYVYYRMGIVRRGDTVTQVLFPPAAGQYAISARDFDSVVVRAGERLAYAPE